MNNERTVVDRVYNEKNQRISQAPEKIQFDFDVNKVKFSNKLPEMKEEPRGKRGPNETIT